MKLVVFGASGQVGNHVVQFAAQRGHEVRAVVRSGANFAGPDAVQVLRGDPLDADFVQRAVAGCDAVASCLGLKRHNPANPWSRLASPEDFASVTGERIVAAMQRAAVSRVCAISAAGVGDSAPRMNLLMKLFVATSNVGVGYRDLARMEQVYARSGLDWQAVRPTRLTDGPRTGRVAVVDAFPLNAAIARADVAGWMLEQLEAPEFIARTPSITGMVAGS